MPLYCGIDLHSTTSYLAVLDEELRLVLQGKCRNDLGLILEKLEPCREDLVAVAVESTYNWYWLVDGLMDAGFDVRLTNTSAVQQYEGLKYSDDRHDARWLARMLALGILPEGYIYPREERPLRDLLRRRSFLVRKRTAFLIAMRTMWERGTGLRTSANQVKRWTPGEMEDSLRDPLQALAMTSMIHVVRAMTVQIKRIEKAVLTRAKLRPEYQLLTSIRGVGVTLALTIMYETGDIRRFAKVGNYASYCRTVNTKRLSDGKRKGSGNRRNGNPHLAWAYTEAAHCVVRFEPLAKPYYDRKMAETNWFVTMAAIANKLARACYYVLRDQVPFEPERAFG